MASYKSILCFYIVFYLVFIVTSITCINVKATCTVTRFQDLDAAAKSCSVLTIKDITIPAKTTMLIAAKKGAKIIFDGKVSHVPVAPSAFGGPIIRVTGSNLDISGTAHHILNGNGPKFWKGKQTPNGRPRLIEFKCDNSQIKNLHLKNSPGAGISIHAKNLVLSNIHIDNKDGYPAVAGNNYAINTDAFGMSSSSNITIKDSTVYNQDDCVVINTGQDLKFDNLWCNGSHGLSLSVFGGDVHGVTFRNCHLEHGMNGIHIKTHNDGSSGTIHDIVFNNITLKNVNGVGVNIQQNYPSGQVKGNIPITKITLNNVVGTVTAKSHAISIKCAKGACSNWHWTNVKITGSKNKNECENVPSGIHC